MGNVIINPFASDVFNAAEMTGLVNRLPVSFSTLDKLKIFKYPGIKTKTFMIVRDNQFITVIPATEPGTPGSVMDNDKRDMLSLSTSHAQVDGSVTASEIADVIDVTKSGAVLLRDYKMLLARKMKKAMLGLGDTLKLMEAHALRGYIIEISKTGTITNRYNLFSEFGITEKIIYFTLATATTNVLAKCRETTDHIKRNLRGESEKGAWGLMSTGFADDFLDHSKVREAYLASARSIKLANESGDLYESFRFGGIEWVTVPDVAFLPDGSRTEAPLIREDEAVVIPKGTTDTFRGVCSPAQNYLDTVNTLGKKFCARREVLDMNKGIKFEIQTDPAVYCVRPEIIVRCKKGAAP